jgi:nitrogenase molybdenum-iron protein beta chain
VACGIGGIFTALAIERILPVMHSGPGCFSSVSNLLANQNGGQSGSTYKASIIPSTNFCESDIIFGGEARLEKLTEECLKYYNADMLLLVDGCSAEIVGDDIAEVAGRFRDAEIPVLHASLPGFKGNNIWGHSQVLNAVIDQYLTEAADEINPLQVNVFGIVPFYDTMWAGTLEQLEKTLIALGLEPNILYGRGKGVDALKKIPAAKFNLLLSPWIDLDIVKKLEKKFGTPFFHHSHIPIGPTETEKFIRRLVKYAGLDDIKAENWIREEDNRYYYHLLRSIPWIYTGRNYPRRFVINSSATQSISLTKFLVNDMGMSPHKIIIIDDVPEEHREHINEYFHDMEYEDDDEPFEVIFTADGGLCERLLKEIDYSRFKPCVFGATWDMYPARNHKLVYVPVSAPYGDKMIGAKTYFGYDGALALLKDFYDDATINSIDLAIT